MDVNVDRLDFIFLQDQRKNKWIQITYHNQTTKRIERNY